MSYIKKPPAFTSSPYFLAENILKKFRRFLAI